MVTDQSSAADPSEREKWQAECGFRERELVLAAEANKLKADELKLKQEEHERSRWSSPLLIAIGAATIAAAANVGVAWWNGVQQREVERENGLRQQALEEQKAEQARILQMINVDNPDSAAANLQFLLRTELILPSRRAALQRYLNERTPGTGISVAPPQTAATAATSAPIEQTEFSRISLEIYVCQGSGAAMRDLANRTLALRPPAWSARWGQPQILSRQTNNQANYRLSRIEVRYNPEEEQAADQLRQLIQSRENVEVNKVLTYFPSPGKISVFFCNGANP